MEYYTVSLNTSKVSRIRREETGTEQLILDKKSHHCLQQDSKVEISDGLDKYMFQNRSDNRV